MVKLKVLMIYLLISHELLYWTLVTINNLGDFTIIMPYGSTSKLRIDCMVIFLTFYGMEQ